MTETEHDCDSITAKLIATNEKRIEMVEAEDIATRRGNLKLAKYYNERIAELTKEIQALKPPKETENSND